MKDYKARPGPKGRKPERKSSLSRRKARPEGLPRGFPPLARPPAPPRPERVPWLRAWVRRAVRVPLRTVLPAAVFTGALLWLAAGLVSGAVLLWQAPLREVRLSGNDAVSADDVVRLGGLAAGMPMHAVDPFAVAHRLAGHPRVISADVRRLYPGRVAIRLHERQAELRVRLGDGRTAVVDADNVVLSMLPRGAAAPEGIGALPLIRGVDRTAVPSRPLHDAAVNRGRAALAALSELGFAEAPRIVVDGGDPFLLTLHLPGGPRLIVPHEQLEPALRVYKGLVEQAPEVLANEGTVDLSAVEADGSGRVFLRRQ